MNTNKIFADFQFLDNKVIDFHIKNNLLNTKNDIVKVDYDMDYEIVSCNELEDNYLGSINLIVNLIGKIEDEKMFEIYLTMNGKFTGSKNNLSIDKFEEMLKVNGTATLSQISRAYITSVTSLSGIISINLPMVNIHAMKKYKEEISDEKNNNI